MAELGGISTSQRLFAERSDVPPPEREVSDKSAFTAAAGRGSASGAMRVLLVASAGGHWVELHRLGTAFADADCQFVSTSSGMTPPVGNRRILEIPDTARDAARTIVPTLIALFRIFRAFDPDVVVSTGAAPGALALLVGRLFGARTIWIDSIANSEELSLSGRLAKPIADLRITQWPHLARADRSLRYLGQIL